MPPRKTAAVAAADSTRKATLRATTREAGKRKRAEAAPAAPANGKKRAARGAGKKATRAGADANNDDAEDPEADEGQAKPAKRGKHAATAARSRVPRTQTTIGASVNRIPNWPLDVFVFGTGTCGELGLGGQGYDGETRLATPCLNPLLSGADVGVVDFACGYMHAVALTKDNKLLSWGIREFGALGRPLDDGPQKVRRARNEGDEENMPPVTDPAEATPAPVDTSLLHPDIRWAKVAASGHASFALTEDGRVYGWGAFYNEPDVSFIEPNKCQDTPTLIPALEDIRALAGGGNHVLALDGQGRVFSWGCGKKNLLGRVPKSTALALRPALVDVVNTLGLKVVKVAAGDSHSFVLDVAGGVYAWGANECGQLGTDYVDGDLQLLPCKVEALAELCIVDIAGGHDHSLAVTTEGQLFAWGNTANGRTGLHPTDIPDEPVDDDNPIVCKPTRVKNADRIAALAPGRYHSIVLDDKGDAFAWGTRHGGQTGLLTDDEEPLEVKVPTKIQAGEVQGKLIDLSDHDNHLSFAGVGESFSILAAQKQGEQ